MRRWLELLLESLERHPVPLEPIGFAPPLEVLDEQRD